MKKGRLIFLIGAFLAWGSLQALAGGGPCNYIVLYDQTDTNSVAVANYYQQVRGIPERNMVPYTFFPNGSTSFSSNNLWSLTLYLRQVIQERGLTGRFNGIAVAGTVPLLASSGNLAFQAGLYYSPAFTGAGAYKSYVSDNFAYSVPTNPVTCEIRDDRPFVNGSTTNIYWPVSFVGFTGLNGNTPDEVFALIDRSKAADGARPDGVIYWPTNGDIRSYCRESQIKDVAPIWTARGIRYEVLNGNWVSGKSDIVGQIVGSASADQGINGNTYLPGAWVDHLTSNGGGVSRFGGGGQSSASAWLRAGAYGSSGTVAEPFASARKFPHAHIYTHLRAGASMAEAFWQSVKTPYEIVMLGDPLLQAWAQIPQVSISAPAQDATVSGTVSISATASTACPDGLEAQYELAVDGHIVRTNDAISATWNGSGFSLNTTTLSDGWHEIRVVAYNNNAIHTQGEARRTVFVNNSGQSVTLSGPGTLEYTSNGTFTVSLSGIAAATNITIQANGRTLAVLPPSGGSTNLSGSLFGYQGATKLYALAWLNNGKQVWSAPLNVSMNWTPAPALTGVTPGASIANIRCFSSTTNAAFDWDSATPDAVTNFSGAGLFQGWDNKAMDYRAYSVDTNVFAPSSYAARPGFDSTMYFLAPVDGLYEFAVNDEQLSDIRLEVGGRPVQPGLVSSSGRITSAPIRLAAGLHPLRLRFKAIADGYLAELWYRGGTPPGNYNVQSATAQFLPMDETVCFGPAPAGNAAPVITDGPFVAAASKTNASLSVTASDPDSTNALTYIWAKINGPGKMTFNTNILHSSTNLAKFSRAGDYRLRVLVSDGVAVSTGEVVTSVAVVRSKISLTPSNPAVRAGASLQFTASSLDQFGTADVSRPFVWSVLGAGTVSTNGLYTAPLTTGTNKVVVSADGLSTTNPVSVVDNFAPVIGAVSLKLYGDSIQCQVAATDDAGPGNLTYVWEPFGVQPGNITFPSNGTPANPSYGFFDRFGTYNLRVGVTDGNGATVWSTNRLVFSEPAIQAVRVIDADGNHDGRIDEGESAEVFVELARGSDYGTNTPVSAVLSVTNTPGLNVIQSSSAFPPDQPGWLMVSNLTPFRIAADNTLIAADPRHLVLIVTIGGASGEVPFSLPASAPYTVTESHGAAIVPGTNNLGLSSHTGTNVALPFAYSFGGQSFTNVFVNGYGLLQFSSQDTLKYWGPIPAEEGWNNLIAVHWDALTLHLPGCGIFTSVSGTAPNRIFNIEWRAVRNFDTNQFINCEARLYESEPRVDLIYGTVDNSGAEACVGIQVSPESYIAYSNYEPVLTNGLQLSFVLKSDTGAPTARFSVSPASGWAPLPVTFSDTSTGGITNRFWDFGDGTTTNTALKSLTHTYTSTGSYTVGLTVSGAEGASTNIQAACVTVTVPVAPSAAFTLNPSSGTVPLAVSFTDSSTGDITNRFWNFGDGVTTNTTATTVSHTYTSVGTNSVTLIVRGPAGSSTNTQAGAVTVTLPPPPVANFSASPVSGMAPLAVVFTDTSTGIITNRTWSFGDGTTNTTATSVSHTYTVAGTNTVQLIVSGPGGSSTNTQANLISVAAGFAGQLVVYDPFTAPTNKLGSVGGWAPAGWTATDLTTAQANAYIREGSLTVAGLKASQGNSLGLSAKGADYYLDFNTVTLGVGDTVYFSFIQKFNVIPGSTCTGAGGYIRLGNSADATSVTKGIYICHGSAGTPASNNAGFGLSAKSAAYTDITPVKTSGTYDMTATYFVAGSYTRGAGATDGSLKLWINPDSGTFGTANPPTPTVSMASLSNADTFNRLFIMSNGSTSWPIDWQLDEVRIGTGWAQVAPSESSAPPGDADGDGIPDEWENQYFGGSTNANPHALAANGVNTIYETYIAGLNPTNPTAIFNLSAAQNRLQWGAVSGRVYSVYWTTNLLNGFQPLETNLVWPQSSWTDTVHGVQGGSFYRITVQTEN